MKIKELYDKYFQEVREYYSRDFWYVQDLDEQNRYDSRIETIIEFLKEIEKIYPEAINGRKSVESIKRQFG